MNNFIPEDLLAIARQKNEQEVEVSQLARNTRHFSYSKRLLGTLGVWMVANGEKLQTLNADALQTTQLSFSQNKTRKARA